MSAPRKPTIWGPCFNCGSTFPEKSGYSLSAHTKDCWGRDGKSPHPDNPGMTREQRTVAARQARMLAKPKSVDSGNVS